MSAPVRNALRAVLFDIDGTLVDSNYLHVDAWQQAFLTVGAPVDSWRIHRRIGMDSGRMLRELLGDRAEHVGEEAKTIHSKLYRESAARLRPFRGVLELMNDLESRGIAVLLATSAPADELEILLDVLELARGRFVTTSAEDVAAAKPQPGIVETALERVHVGARDAVFVGDTVWDMLAATTAGVAPIGVLSGGIAPDELRAAGALQIAETVAELAGIRAVPLAP